MRLQKLLAQAGVASRRAAEALIARGLVRVNGEVVTAQGVQIDPRRDRVEVEGRRLHVEPPRYQVLLKPRGVLSVLPGTPVAPDRPTLARFWKEREPGWRVVAPLDFWSEGLILLTTDGDLADRLSRKGGGLTMTYHVKLQGIPGDDTLTRLRRGWRFEDRPVRPQAVEKLATTGKNLWIEVVVREARPRALKAMGLAVRHTVLKLSRVRLGDISFEGLAMGVARELTKAEVASLRDAVVLKGAP